VPYVDHRHKVCHNYHDHSYDAFDESITAVVEQKRGSRGGVSVPFPTKLHVMLSSVEAEGQSDIVSWQPHGRCFVLHKPQEFVDTIMAKYFKQTKLTSFQRQLNLYGFARITKGKDRGGYYHELFLRHKLFLCQKMTRIRIKGTGVKGRSNPESEPNFYSMTFLTEKDDDKINRDLEEEIKHEIEETSDRSSPPSGARHRASSQLLRPRAISDAENTDLKRVLSESDEDEEDDDEEWLPTSKVAPEKKIMHMGEAVIISPELSPKPVFTTPSSMTIDKLANSYEGMLQQRQLNRHNISTTFREVDVPLEQAQPVTEAQMMSFGSSIVVGPESPRTGDEISFEGQRFYYLDSFTVAASGPVTTVQNPIQSRRAVPSRLSIARSIQEPILTPSASTSSIYDGKEEEAVVINPHTIFSDKEESDMEEEWDVGHGRNIEVDEELTRLAAF